MKLDFIIDGNNFDMAGEASSSVKKTLAKLGVSPPVIKKVAVAMYEAEINAFIHGGGGTAQVEIDSGQIRIVISDSGKESKTFLWQCRRAGPQPASRCGKWDSARAWGFQISRSIRTSWKLLLRREKVQK